MVFPATFGFSLHDEVESKEFQAFCISLANEIDDAIGKNEVPKNVEELALTLNHTCQRRCDDQTKAVVMMLMISVKNACQLGWFPPRETRELLDIVDLMWKDFSSLDNVIPSVNSPISLIPQVIERFYPFVKLGHILLSFEAKPESNILVKDFHISEKIPHSPKMMVGLFVIRTEDISKSNCIIHPQEVSFLLNGMGITKRVKISMDSGPQLPTDVTALLNVGANLLQTIGCFGGTYFIAIAFMDVISLPDRPLLKDYVHSEVIESNSDCDIIEGPSRISLNCPISRTRIKFPVKGHVCKHLQCFDFWNYVNMNMRRPSWRCPHCNQSVCYTDIRVDQKMIKILEVGHNAAAVFISADGSWTVEAETDEDVELMPETNHEHGGLNNFVNLGPNVLDLTRDENEMETSGGTQVDEHNLLSEIQGLSNNTYKPATDCTMLNQSSASFNALPQLPQTLSEFNGQQFMNLPQLVNIRDSTARGALPMSSLPISSPQDRLAINTSSPRTSMPVTQPSRFQGSHVAHSSRFQGSHAASTQFQGSHVAAPYQLQGSHAASSQYQGSHVASLGHCRGRTSSLMERWNHFYGSAVSQTRLPHIRPPQYHFAIQNQTVSIRSMSPAQKRPSLSSSTHSQALAVNYRGGTTAQRPIPSSTNLPVNYVGTVNQRPIPDVTTGGQFSPRQEFMNMTSPDTINWRPQTRMRGSIAPGSTAYDHMIIRPTRPVEAQAQTLPPPQPTPYNSITDELQAFLAHPSYPTSYIETQGGTGSLPAAVGQGVGLQGSFWSMPPEAW